VNICLLAKVGGDMGTSTCDAEADFNNALARIVELMNSTGTSTSMTFVFGRRLGFFGYNSHNLKAKLHQDLNNHISIYQHDAILLSSYVNYTRRNPGAL
jgi:hypothetical protein